MGTALLEAYMQTHYNNVIRNPNMISLGEKINRVMKIPYSWFRTWPFHRLLSSFLITRNTAWWFLRIISTKTDSPSLSSETPTTTPSSSASTSPTSTLRPQSLICSIWSTSRRQKRNRIPGPTEGQIASMLVWFGFRFNDYQIILFRTQRCSLIALDLVKTKWVSNHRLS